MKHHAAGEVFQFVVVTGQHALDRRGLVLQYRLGRWRGNERHQPVVRFNGPLAWFIERPGRELVRRVVEHASEDRSDLLQGREMVEEGLIEGSNVRIGFRRFTAGIGGSLTRLDSRGTALRLSRWLRCTSAAGQ